MSRAFLTLSSAGALLTANAVRPVRLGPLAVPSFFAGWLAAELAPHNLAITAAGTAAFVARGHVHAPEDRVALALSAGTVAGLSGLIVQGQRAQGIVEDALLETLGDDYAELLDPRPARHDLATPWRQLVLPFRMRHPDVERVRDLPYAGTRHPRQLLDVYRRKDHPRGAPVLFQVHGGGWMIGRKDQQGIPLMLHMAARGWVCVSANYRLSPRAVWPDHLVDLKRALAWVRANIGEYGGDPSFIAVTGGSAGGHLSAMLGLTAGDPEYQPGFESADTSVQACVPHYGVYDFADVTGLTEVRRRNRSFVAPLVLRRNPHKHPEAFRKASPILRVRPDAPPFFVLHGHHDTLVPVAEARAFVDRLRAVSRSPVVYAELPGTQHAFDIFPSIRSAHVVRGVERFLRWSYARSGIAHPSVA